MADDDLTVPDWLGRPQPVLRKSLELTTSGGGGGVTAPVTPSATQRAVDLMRATPPSPTGPSRLAQQILGGIRTGVSATEQAADLLSRSGEETTQAPAGVFTNVTPRGPSSEVIPAQPGVFTGVQPSGPVSTQAPGEPGAGFGPGEPGATGGGIGEAGAGAGTQAVNALSGTAGAAVQVLPYLTAAISVAQDALSNRQNSIKALDAVIDVAGAALVPFTYGLSTLAGSLSKEDLDRMNADFQQGNWLRGIALDTFANPVTLVADVVQLFGGPDFTKNFLRGNKGTRYTRTRENAVNQANEAFAQLGQSFQGVRDLPTALAAIQQRFGGGHVGTGLQLPAHVAEWIGLAPSPNGTYGWSSLDGPQFQRLMTYFAQYPDQIGGSVTSSGDIPYLPQEQAEQVSLGARRATESLLGAVARAMVIPPPRAATMPTSPLTPSGPAGALGFAQDLLG